MIKKWIQEFLQGLVKVDVHVEDQYQEVIKLTREHEKAKVLLSRFHEAYRNCMTNQGFINSYSAEFYRVGKETAKMLDIPLWQNITPPNGMPGCGGEPLLSRPGGEYGRGR